MPDFPPPPEEGRKWHLGTGGFKEEKSRAGEQGRDHCIEIGLSGRGARGGASTGAGLQGKKGEAGSSGRGRGRRELNGLAFSKLAAKASLGFLSMSHCN